MKKLLIALSLLLSSCAAVKTPYTDSRGDREAAYAQRLMNNAVKFEETVTVLITDFAEGAPSIAGMKSSGSGVVVGVNEGEGTSTILTAWHVCDRYPVGLKQEDLFQSYEVIEDEQVVITPDQKRIPVLKVVYSSKAADTCMVKVKHVFASHAEFADQMPPRGAQVQVVGAPLGQWGDFLVSMAEGRFFGYTDIDVVAGIQDTSATHMEGFAYYGFAGVGGYSGSGIYYKGKLIGLHTAGSTRYEHASYGPALKELQRAVKEAKN
jgi:S1-C subfamily serine protease